MIGNIGNQIDGNVHFTSDNYHLAGNSLAIGIGDDAGVTDDIDKEARPSPSGTKPDVGCDEEASSTPAPTPEPVVIECDTFQMSFAGNGKPSKLIYKATNQDILNIGANNGFEFYNETNPVQIAQVSKQPDGKYLFESEDKVRSILVEIAPKGKYCSFRIFSISGVPYASNAKLRFKLATSISGQYGAAIPVQYGQGIGFGVLGLDYMSYASAGFTVDWSYLWHRYEMPNDPIGSFAIFACGESDTLSTVGTIEIGENLPHPVLDGVWGKQNNYIARLTPMYIWFNNPTERDKAAQFAQEAGIGIFYIAQTSWEGSSSFNINTTNFPGGMDTLRSFSDSLRSKGLLLGIHTGSATLRSTDQVIQPVPDNRLAAWTSGTLAATVAAGDQEIRFTPVWRNVLPTIDPNEIHGLRPPTYCRIWDYKVLRIGNELIRIGGFDTSSVPWRLTGCTRGIYGTSASAHSAGDLTRGLMTVYGACAVDPNTLLLDDLATKMANVINYCKVSRTSFDALETVDYAGRWAMRKFIAMAQNKFDHYVACESSSGLPPFEWHVSSCMNCGEWTHCMPRGYFEGYLLNNTKTAQASFCPGGLGSWSFRIDNKAYHASTPDEYEWWLAKAAAWDSPYFFGLTNVSDYEQHGQRSRIFELTSKWEKIRLHNALSAAQRQQMQDFNMSYRLISSDDRTAQWQIAPTKIRPTFPKCNPMESTPNGSISVDNPFSDQPLRFEARVLPAFDYTTATNISILPTDPGQMTLDSGLGVVRNGSEWTFTSGATGNARRASWNTNLNLTGNRAVGMYFTGNGTGGYLFVELKSANGGVRHFTIPNNTAQRQYVEIPTDEVDHYYYLDDLYGKWGPESSNTIYWNFSYGNINRISWGLINVPSGQTAAVIVEAPKALAERPVSLVNPKWEIGAGSLSITGTIPSGSYLVYEGGSTADVLDPNRHITATLPASAVEWIKPAGSSNITVRSRSNVTPYLKVLYKMLGVPISFPNPVPKANASAAWLQE